MLRRIINKLKSFLSKKKPAFYYIAFTLIGFASLIPLKMQAESSSLTGLGAWIVRMLLWIFYLIFVLVMGKIATLAMRLVAWISTFSGFTTMSAVNEAWKVVRDLSNLGFIVILLVIAFGTILKIESYSYKKMLPKMIVAAIFINFSKLICGLIVDASQIIMLTFVNAFKDSAYQGLYYVFRLGDLLTLGQPVQLTVANQPTAGQSWTELDYLITSVAAGAMITFMAVLLITIALTLLFRVVIIWTLTILSPIAFVSSILPATQKYSQKWWDTFTRYVMVGPFLAFFIWLALFAATKAGDSGLAASLSTGSALSQENYSAEGGDLISPSVVVNYLIGVLLLMVGLQFSQEMSSEIGSYVGKFSGLPTAFAGKLWGMPGAIGRGLGRGAMGFGRGLGKFVGMGINDLSLRHLNFDLNLKRQWENVRNRWKENSARTYSKARATAFDRVEAGGLKMIIGFAGAADAGLDHLPLGQQGLVRGMRQMWGDLWRTNQKKYAEGSEEEKAANEERTKKMAEYGIQDPKDLKAEEERYKQEQQLNSIKNDGTIKNLPKNADTAINLLKAAKEKEKDGTKKDEIDKFIEDIQHAKDNKESTLRLKGAASLLIRERENAIKDINKVRREAGLDDRGRAIKKNEDGKPVLDANNRPVLVDLHDSNIVNAIKEEQRTSELRLKQIKEKMAAHAPMVDYAKVANMRALAAEAAKGIETNNEDDLKDQLIQAVHHQDGVKALAIMNHMAKVSHANEIPNAFGLDANAGNLKMLAQQLFTQGGQGLKDERGNVKYGNLGLSEQLVNGMFDDISRNAKQNNHWAFAEMMGTKNGRFEFRDEPERQHRIFIEASKVGLENILRSGNRLAFGDYYTDEKTGEQAWKLVPGMMALLKRGMSDSLKNSLANGYRTINDNFLEFLHDNPKELNKLEQISKNTADILRTQANQPATHEVRFEQDLAKAAAVAAK